MKIKLTYLLLLGFLLTTCFTSNISYAATNTQIITRMDSNGGYWVETITTPQSIYGTKTQKTSTKTTKYYNANDELCWKYSLTATFSVNTGVSATCTDSSAKLSIYKSGYSLYNEKHSHSGNEATGTIKIKHNGVVKAKTISLTCTKNGTIS